MTIRRVFQILLAAELANIGLRQTVDPDLRWHLRTGEYVCLHGIPKHDVFSFSVPNQPWVTHGKPPLSQICGVFLNAIFLDHLDTDLDHLLRMNELIQARGEHAANGISEPMRVVTPLVVNRLRTWPSSPPAPPRRCCGQPTTYPTPIMSSRLMCP